MEEIVVCKLWLNFGYDSTSVLIMLRKEDKKSFEDDILNMPHAFVAGSSPMIALNKMKKLIGGRVVDVKSVEFKYTPIDKFNFWNGGKAERWYDGDGRLNIKTEIYNWYFLEG